MNCHAVLSLAVILLVLVGALVLLALAFLTPMFYYIPDAALAAVIIMAVTDMINFSMVKQLWDTNSTPPSCYIVLALFENRLTYFTFFFNDTSKT